MCIKCDYLSKGKEKFLRTKREGSLEKEKKAMGKEKFLRTKREGSPEKEKSDGA